MADDTRDIPKTHDEIEKIAEVEDEAGVVDQQAAAKKDAGKR
jgi:hypothetical protein